MIKVKINKYFLNISNKNDAKKYEVIKKECSALGYKLFDCISISGEHHKMAEMPEDQTIDPSFLFENQYNTFEGYRVFEWKEEIYRNKHVKEGYYLTGDINALNELKQAHYVCGYCGNRHQGHDAPLTCSKCLGNEYLTEEYLPLLVMQPLIGPKRQAEGPSKKAFEEVQSRFKAAQIERLKAEADKVLAKVDEACAKLRYEAETQAKVLRSGFSIDNLIYYSHKNEWVWGWRDGVTKEESERIRSVDWDFNFKIIHKDKTAA